MPLDLPPFKLFRPRELKKLEDRIVNNERIVEIFSNDRIETALEKLKSGLPLTRKDFKILCFHLERVMTDGMLEVFLPQLLGFFNKAEHYPGHLKGLLVSYYDLFKNEAVFSVLQYAVKKSSDTKEYMQLVANMLKKSSGCRDFLHKMLIDFDNSTSITDIEEISELYFVGKNKNIYVSIIQLIIAQKIRAVDSSDSAEYLIDLMNEINDVTTLKPFFESYLLLFTQVQFFDNQKDHFNRIFEYIGEKMGNPYKGGKARWIGVSQDALDVYTLWQTQKKIKYFFGDIAGDPFRLRFWKGYSHYFLRVEFFSQFSGAILMESKEHLFIEFAQVGAMYMFRREIQNIDQIEQYPGRYNNTDIIQKLKDRRTCNERIIHYRHQWQSTFSSTLAGYGYKARG